MQQPQVMGRLDMVDDDDETSVDEDSNSDGGEVSMAGSDRGQPLTGPGLYGSAVSASHVPVMQ